MPGARDQADYALAHNNLGTVLLRLGQTDEALGISSRRSDRPRQPGGSKQSGGASIRNAGDVECHRASARSDCAAAERPGANADLAWTRRPLGRMLVIRHRPCVSPARGATEAVSPAAVLDVLAVSYRERRIHSRGRNRRSCSPPRPPKLGADAIARDWHCIGRTNRIEAVATRPFVEAPGHPSASRGSMSPGSRPRRWRTTLPSALPAWSSEDDGGRARADRATKASRPAQP